jgi:hypothetical protein
MEITRASNLLRDTSPAINGEGETPSRQPVGRRRYVFYSEQLMR